MPLIDVTLGMKNGMIAFPDDPLFRVETVASRALGNPYELSVFHSCTHSGTHIDAPTHYLDGTNTIDQIPLEYLIGDGIILDMRSKEIITAKDIKDSPFDNHERVLFRTDNSEKLRNSIITDDFCSLTLDGAEFLTQRGIKVVGIDYLSIENFEDSHGPVHRILLGSGAVIVEALDLLEAPIGQCKIYCLPLKIISADGAPARVVVET
ncbi:MAG: cyclase family protein [Desulfomonilaceae bacterium]